MFTISPRPKSSSNPVGFVEVRPTNYNPAGSKKYPLLLFFHGDGQQGSGSVSDLSAFLTSFDINKLLRGVQRQWNVNGETFEFITLMPQMTLADGGWTVAKIEQIIRFAEENLSIDRDRIYLTGLSRGGDAIWKFLTSIKSNVDKIAAVFTCCTVRIWHAANFCLMKDVALWSIHSRGDVIVPYTETTAMHKFISDCGPTAPPTLTLYTIEGHEIWNIAYDPDRSPGRNGETLTMYEWLLMNKRFEPITLPTGDNPSIPAPVIDPNTPIADAGPDVTVNNLLSYTLDASRSKGKFGGVYWMLEKTEPAHIFWTHRPSNTWFTPNGKLNLSNLVPGTKYFFRLDIPAPNGVIVSSDHMVLTVTNYTTSTPPLPSQEIDQVNIERDMNQKIIRVTIIFMDGRQQIINSTKSS